MWRRRSSQRFDQSPGLSRHPQHAGLDGEGTWSDETTHAVQESLTLRTEFVHETSPRDTNWTLAAYESPIGECLWYATVTASTPVEIMRARLGTLASGAAWEMAVGSQVCEETITEATSPLVSAG